MYLHLFVVVIPLVSLFCARNKDKSAHDAHHIKLQTTLSAVARTHIHMLLNMLDNMGLGIFDE